MPQTTNVNEEQPSMRCTSCKGQKHSLRLRKSKLIEGVDLFLCEDCFTNKREPRWAIILVARQNGVAAVSDWIKNERYVGDPILVDELID